MMKQKCVPQYVQDFSLILDRDFMAANGGFNLFFSIDSSSRKDVRIFPILPTRNKRKLPKWLFMQRYFENAVNNLHRMQKMFPQQFSNGVLQPPNL